MLSPGLMSFFFSRPWTVLGEKEADFICWLNNLCFCRSWTALKGEDADLICWLGFKLLEEDKMQILSSSIIHLVSPGLDLLLMEIDPAILMFIGPSWGYSGLPFKFCFSRPWTALRRKDTDFICWLNKFCFSRSLTALRREDADIICWLKKFCFSRS